MGFESVFFGKSPDLKAAEKWLRSREDEVFKMQPGEDRDIAIHTHADLPRHELLKGRLELTQAFARQSSNRNLAWTLAGFSVVLVKLFGGADALANAGKILLRIFGL